MEIWVILVVVYFVIGLVIAFSVAIDMVADMGEKVETGTDGCAAILAVSIMFLITLTFWLVLIPAIKITRKYGKGRD